MTRALAETSRARLAPLETAVSDSTRSGEYFGASIAIARHGRLVAELAIGHADAAGSMPIVADSVFNLFSISKAFVNVLVLRWIETGRLSLATHVRDVLPEFSVEQMTIANLLTYTSGLAPVWEVAPGRNLDNLTDTVADVIAHVPLIAEPGTRCEYSPMANHVLLSEALRRTDPLNRTITQILQDEIWDPLTMTDTALGVKPHLRERHVVPDFRGVVPVKMLSSTSPGPYGLTTGESNESTWAGAVGTASDLLRFTEMLRREGEYEGARILAPESVRLARSIHTGDLPNELTRSIFESAGIPLPPANYGLGFNVRGVGQFPTQLGLRASPRTFGNSGAGSALYWIDPDRDLSFVALTAGLLAPAQNTARFQALSDLAVEAAQ